VSLRQRGRGSGICACLLICSLWHVVADATPALQFLTENQPPLSTVEHGQVGGIATAIISEMLKRAHIDGQFSQLPWARAYVLSQQQADTCVYPIVRSAERGPLFQWVGPIAVNQWVLYGGPQFTGHLNSLDDARPYRIGGTLRDAKSDYLRAQGFSRLELVADEETNARKLAAGHLDLWIAATGRAQQLIDSLGLKGLRPLLVIGRNEQYLACNRGVKPELIAQLNNALAAMRKDGSLRVIAGKSSP